MKPSSHLIVLAAVALLATGPAFAEVPETTGENPEIGGLPGPPREEDSTVEPLRDLDAQLDLSFQYTRFTGEDMHDSYGGLPQVGALFSVAVYPQLRVFTSLGYGRGTGDPYHDLQGDFDRDLLQVQTVPFQLGMKFDVARSTRVRMYFGGAVEVAWMRERIPVVGGDGGSTNLEASAVNTGYQVAMGPEIVLGQGRNAVGLEIGYGGAKGVVSTTGHHHDLDLTGIRGRVYYALGL